MKKTLALILPLILISLTAHASPFSYADQQEYYIQATGGFVLSSESDISHELSPGRGDIGFDDGANMAISIGKHFENLRFEVEYSLRKSDYDTSLSFNDLTHNSIMFNLLYETQISDTMFFYAGGGIGGSKVKIDLASASDDEIVWAFQGLMGLGYKLADNVSLLLGYRLSWTEDPKFSINNRTGKAKSPWMNVFEVGIRYGF